MENNSQKTASPPEARAHSSGDHSGNGKSDGAAHQSAKSPVEHDAVDLDMPKPPAGWIVAAGIMAVIALIMLFIVGLIPRLHTHKDLAADAENEANAPIPVNIVHAKRAPTTVEVLLPGTLRPWQEVSIYSRTTGYLKKFHVDISNQVEAGQLMADIETPEIDQQLRGSQAALLQQQAAEAKAQTDLAFAESTYKRFESLRGSSGVTQQELDQFKSQLSSAQANLRSAQANITVAQADVQRLTEMKSFERVVAPFSGVVTGRAYDNGSLILANPTTTTTLPMFKLAENDVLRAFVNVPQNYALTIQKDMKVTITARERSGREFIGVVLGTTNYLDPSARSLLTEIMIKNPDFALLPGMFVDATFHVVRDNPPLIIPAPALIINADGNQVALVKDGKVHFQKISLGIDYGNEIEIVSGLNGDEQIIGNPGEKAVEGAQVKVVGEEKIPPPAGEKETKPQEKVAGAAGK